MTWKRSLFLLLLGLGGETCLERTRWQWRYKYGIGLSLLARLEYNSSHIHRIFSPTNKTTLYLSNTNSSQHNGRKD